MCLYRAIALLSLGVMLLPLSAYADEKPAIQIKEAWPNGFEGHYSLRFNGIEVGSLKAKANTTKKSYSFFASADASALFGVFKWSGSSSVYGIIKQGIPTPVAYRLNWRINEKPPRIANVTFRGLVAKEITITPQPSAKPDTVPLKPAHIVGVLDPLSAILMLTKANSRPPCDRRVSIFDGMQRFDIVLTPKYITHLPPSSAGQRSETGYVCRIMYKPVAGHQDNNDTKEYASKLNMEVVLRRIPGSKMLILHAIRIPTLLGIASMVTERININSATTGKIAFTN